MKIAIYGNKRQERYLGELGGFFSMLAQNGMESMVSREFAGYLESHGVSLPGAVVVDECPDDAEAVISIGGDGTFLRAAQWQGSREIPILGINTGHLGFLASYSLEEAPILVHLLAERAWETESRMVLKVEGDGVPDDFWPYVLNELSVVKGDTTHMVNVRTEVDGYFLADYQADGLIVATPTGSTAYNLSAGGPILQPTLKNMILSPIAPHSLTVRPLVIGADTRVDLRITGRGEECHVGADGRIFAIPCNGSRLTVTRAPFCVKVLRRPDTDFATVLRKKLLWARR